MVTAVSVKRGVTRAMVALWALWAGIGLLDVSVRYGQAQTLFEQAQREAHRDAWAAWAVYCIALPAVLLTAFRWTWAGFEKKG